MGLGITMSGASTAKSPTLYHAGETFTDRAAGYVYFLALGKQIHC